MRRARRPTRRPWIERRPDVPLADEHETVGAETGREGRRPAEHVPADAPVVPPPPKGRARWPSNACDTGTERRVHPSAADEQIAVAPAGWRHAPRASELRDVGRPDRVDGLAAVCPASKRVCAHAHPESVNAASATTITIRRTDSTPCLRAVQATGPREADRVS